MQNAGQGGAAFFSVQIMPTPDAITQIMEAVEAYASGLSFGDEKAIRAAFHPKAQFIGRFEGELEWEGLEAFILACRDGALNDGEPAPAYEIHAIEVAGDTAMVKLATTWAGIGFYDTLNLIRHEDRWQIVTRVFAHLG